VSLRRIFHSLGEFFGDLLVFCFGWMVGDVVEFVGFVAEFILLLFEGGKLRVPPMFGERAWFLDGDG